VASSPCLFSKHVLGCAKTKAVQGIAKKNSLKVLGEKQDVPGVELISSDNLDMERDDDPLLLSSPRRATQHPARSAPVRTICSFFLEKDRNLV
jgi:hypothetical protein